MVPCSICSADAEVDKGSGTCSFVSLVYDLASGNKKAAFMVCEDGKVIKCNTKNAL